MSDNEDGEKYLSLSDEMHEIRYGTGLDKSVAGLKIIGKSLFNIGKFTVSEVLPAATTQMEREVEKGRK